MISKFNCNDFVGLNYYSYYSVSLYNLIFEPDDWKKVTPPLISPNPANSFIQLDILNNKTNDAVVEFYDSFGQRLYEVAESGRISIQYWPAGMYVARLISRSKQVILTKKRFY